MTAVTGKLNYCSKRWPLSINNNNNKVTMRRPQHRTIVDLFARQSGTAACQQSTGVAAKTAIVEEPASNDGATIAATDITEDPMVDNNNSNQRAARITTKERAGAP
jgi:hypothetical protein